MSAPTKNWTREEFWMDKGFTREEAAAMIKGSTLNECYQRHGGVWQVGNVQWYQAISAAHAEKLYKHQFGIEKQAQFIKAPTTKGKPTSD